MQQQFVQAVRAFQQGDFARAIELSQRLLESHPEHPNAMQLLGASLCESGQIADGINWLDRAARQTDDAEAWYNLGSAQLRAGQSADALMTLDRVLELKPDHVSAIMNRGSALDALERPEDSRTAYQNVLSFDPTHVGALHNLANLDLDAGHSEAAENGFRRALSFKPDHPGAWLGLGMILLERRQTSAAVDALRTSTRYNPNNATTWSMLGRALNSLDDYPAAMDAHRRSTELEPDCADYHNNLGALHPVEQAQQAEQSLKRALELDPSHAAALGNLASLYEVSQRHDECRQLIETGLESCPDHPALLLARAKLLRHDDQLEPALAVLDDLAGRDSNPMIAREIGFQRAQILDRLKRTEEAYQVFESVNRNALEYWQQDHPEPDELLPACQKLRQLVDDGWARDWPTPSTPSVPQPAFLVGFQRSGTTLLDTMLGAHGGVHVIEEYPIISRVIERMNRDYGQYPDELPGLNDEALEALRRHYHEMATELTQWDMDSGLLLLDKSPLNTMHIGLISRLFPDAPVVLALRHPCDVCLSCFMQDFTLTPFMARYTTLEGVVVVYDEIMGLGQGYRDSLAFRRHEIRYESLVDDTEGELRKLLEFLGLPWRDAVLEHTGHAQSRGIINTPSYNQVTQPVYRSARFRWHRYRDQMAPVMPVLQSWIDTFGYAEPD